MAEIQTNTQSGELSQRFIEFVMMQAQNTALFLGQIPNPQTGQGEVNLELAKMFIDQLAMIQEKTRGNLSNEEATVLRSTLSNLQMAFVDASQHERAGSSPARPATAGAAASSTIEEPSGKPTPTDHPETDVSAAPQSETESRKKFTKSYGA